MTTLWLQLCGRRSTSNGPNDFFTRSRSRPAPFVIDQTPTLVVQRRILIEQQVQPGNATPTRIAARSWHDALFKYRIIMLL